MEGKYAGDLPVITSKKIGEGRVIYCGTNPSQGRAKLPAGFQNLVGRALRAADIKPVLHCQTGEPESVVIERAEFANPEDLAGGERFTFEGVELEMGAIGVPMERLAMG